MKTSHSTILFTDVWHLQPTMPVNVTDRHLSRSLQVTENERRRRVSVSVSRQLLMSCRHKAAPPQRSIVFRSEICAYWGTPWHSRLLPKCDAMVLTFHNGYQSLSLRMYRTRTPSVVGGR